MGPAYVLGAGGTLGGLYGLAWTYDNAGYPLNTGYAIQHCLAVANAGTVYSLIGQGIWTSGLIRANGIISTGSDMRSPIFYDSDNTGYYGDFGGASRMDTLHANFIGVGQAINTSYRIITSGDYYANAGGNYWAEGRFKQYRGSGTWHDVIDSGNFTSYMDAPNKAGTTYYQTNTWMQFNGSYGLYWPNDNGCHIYPNSATTYTQFRFDGVRNGYSGVYLGDSGVNGMMYDIAGNGGVYKESISRWYFYYHIGNDCMSIGTSSTSSTYSLYLNKGIYAQSRIDAPIFYDYNNTGYYLDPASTSLINEINLAGAINYTGSVAVDSGFGIYFSANRDTAYGIFREAGAWASPYPDLRIAFHTGIKLGANSSYNGIRFYNDYTMVNQVMSVNNGSDPLGANNVYVNNNLMAGVSLRAPICYDSDNTNYYIDAAITSNLNAIVVGTLISNVGWLEVRSNVYTTNPTTTSGLFFGWNKSGGNGEANIIVDGGSNTGQFLFQRYDGGGSYTNILQADINGLTANSGTVSVFSDIRLKTNITNASPKLNDLMKLNVVNYEFVGEYNVLGKQLGFIAQEVEQIFPSLVREQDTRQYDDQGNYITGYQDTKILKVGMEFAMLVKAMQEQQSIIDSLKLEIETIKQKQL